LGFELLLWLLVLLLLVLLLLLVPPLLLVPLWNFPFPPPRPPFAPRPSSWEKIRRRW